jgi:hypothetical protein
MRRARRSQNRAGVRASTRGYKRMKRKRAHGHKRHGRRVGIKRSTFFKLRRKARNPGMSRVLRDGTQVTLDQTGSGAVIRVFSAHGSLLSEKHLHSLSSATRAFKRYSSGKRYAARQEREDYAMLASDNPRHRRGRKGRGRKSRRNCGPGMRRNPAQFPMPFTSALMMNPRRGKHRRNAPISRSDARALARVLRRHGHKHCRA